MWKPTYTYSWPSENELYHHGILGMKWGKKNGPPYPLGSEDHSAAEKKAGWKKSLGGGKTSSVKKKSNKEEAIRIIDKYKGNYKHGFLEGDEEKVVKNAIVADEETICSKMADEVISDIQRWKKEGYESTIGEKGDEELIKKDLKYNLKNIREIFPGGDGKVYFIMDGMEYYCDSQPLDVDYDLKTKKLSYYWS